MDWRTVLHVSASKGPRILFQMSLFAVFFCFFGLPAIEKYKDYDVIVVEKTKFTKGIPLPAITIVVSDQLFGFDYDSCYNMSASAIDECINANSKNWSHIIKGVTQGFVRKKSLSITSNLVKEDFNRLFGRFFTLNITLKIGPNDEKDQMYILLYPKYVYQILIHDPDFFIYNEVATSIPMTRKYFDTRNGKSYFYNFDLAEVNELNHPGDPCNPSPHYNFQNCIKESVTSQVIAMYNSYMSHNTPSPHT